MGFEQETYYNGFLEADYNDLLSVGSDTLDDYLDGHFKQVQGGDGSTYYILRNQDDQYDFLEMLENEGIDAESSGYTLFTYIKSTWSVYGF